MTSECRPLDYLRHMPEAAGHVLHYTAGIDKAAFLADSRTQQAVFYTFVVLGEASAKLMDRHGRYV